MVATPKTEDIRKAREQAVEALHSAAEQVRTPLLAVLGAGDLAAQAVVDAVQRTRERAGAARDTAKELPGDISELRDKLDPAELRKVVDEYTEAAQKLYQKLADAGEDALTRLKDKPQVRKAIDQLEEAIATLQERLGDVAGDARELAEDVLAKVSRRTRGAGEETAKAVEEAGAEAAKQTRAATSKAANATRKAPAKKTTK